MYGWACVSPSALNYRSPGKIRFSRFMANSAVTLGGWFPSSEPPTPRSSGQATRMHIEEPPFRGTEWSARAVPPYFATAEKNPSSRVYGGHAGGHFRRPIRPAAKGRRISSQSSLSLQLQQVRHLARANSGTQDRAIHDLRARQGSLWFISRQDGRWREYRRAKLARQASLKSTRSPRVQDRIRECV